jgi:hypothetical protein
MNETYELDTPDALAYWLKIEQWFLRILGVDMLIIAILSLIFGTLQNTNNEAIIHAFNVIISIILGTGAVWTLYLSRKTKRIQTMIEDFIEQGNSPTYVFAGIQIVVAILFLLEGFSRGQIVMLLLAITMMGGTRFFFWRAKQIGRYQG